MSNIDLEEVNWLSRDSIRDLTKSVNGESNYSNVFKLADYIDAIVPQSDVLENGRSQGVVLVQRAMEYAKLYPLKARIVSDLRRRTDRVVERMREIEKEDYVGRSQFINFFESLHIDTDRLLL